MRTYEWTKELLTFAKYDPHHRQCVSECLALEPSFLAIRAKLQPEEQEILDRYITACEEVQYSLIFVARDLRKNC